MVWGRVAREVIPGAFKLDFPTWNPFRATPIEPPLGVGPTEEIFGPLGPPGPPTPSRRISPSLGFVTPPPTAIVESTAPRAATVPPGYAEIYPLLQNLGIPPIELGRMSRFDWARTPPTATYRTRREYAGKAPDGEDLYEVTTVATDAARWLRSPQENIQKLESVLASGVDELGRNIDTTVVTRNIYRNGQFTEQFETVSLRRIYKERLEAQLAGGARWWLKQRETGGPGFDKEFEWLAVKDAGTDERIAVELFDEAGERIVIPTAAVDASDPDQIFVFGSNLEGVHGAGAAKEAAQKWGAQAGVGRGLTGRAYALPTKRTPSSTKRQFEIWEIETYVDELLEVARANPTKKFMVTPFGTGLAGYEMQEIAKIFAQAAKSQRIPANIFFTDATERGTNEFVSALARERSKLGNEFVTVDVDDLVELETKYFGENALSTRTKQLANLDLPQLPRPSILDYSAQDANQITSEIHNLIKQTVARGDRDNGRVLQGYILRRLQSAQTPRAIVTALKDYREILPIVDNKGAFKVAFRDSVETAMERLGALNKQAAADTYVYLAEEVVDARKLASYIDSYIDDAETFDELLRARFWLDDTFVFSKLSHPELISRNEWSRVEARLVEKVEKQIEVLRGRAKKYMKRSGADLISYRSGMTDDELRKMFSEAIGTARSFDELRLIHGLMNKYEIQGVLREDLNVMIRSIRPIVAARRIRPVRDKDLRRSRIKALSSSVEISSDAEKTRASLVETRRRGAQMAGEEPFYSDIIGWEEGARAYSYVPYNPQEMLRGSTFSQKEWILRESPDFVRRLRLTLDFEELRLLNAKTKELRSTGQLSGRMARYLEKEIQVRKSVILAHYKRIGKDVVPPDADEKDMSSVIAWARAQEGGRRQATRYWRELGIEQRDDFSDFVQNNPLYDQLIHDGQMLDAMAGRSVRGSTGNELFDNPFLDFDDGLGEISIARGDIAEEIAQTTNRRYWEIEEQIESIDAILRKGEDYLGRNLDTETVTRMQKDKTERTLTLREVFQERKAALMSERTKLERQDMSWYQDMNQSMLPFGTRRIVNPTNPDEEMLQVFDFEYEVWLDSDLGEVASRRESNSAYEDFSDAIFPKGEDATLVYTSAPRVKVDANGNNFELPPLVRVFVPDGEGYAYRTFINAYGSDATIAVAANFDSAGEKLTKRFAQGATLRWNRAKAKYEAGRGRGRRTRYVGVDHNTTEFEAELNRVVDQLNEAYRLKGDNPLTVNFAGNGANALGGPQAQAAADEFAYRLMRAVMEHPRRNFTIASSRSGGQNGYDQAFMKAMIRLEIPMDVTLPRAKFGNKVMVQGLEETEYITVAEYLASLGFQRQPIATSFGPLRTASEASSIPGKNVTWGRYPDGVESFEVSTKGSAQGRRFSALNAKLKGRGGKFIEDIYQIDVKGGEKLGPGRYTSKGRGYKGPLNSEQLYAEYKGLWVEFFNENPDMLQEIADLTAGKKIVDQFASSDVSQARAIDEILTERGLRVAPSASAPSGEVT